MSRVGVMHLIDTLSAGGAERMCVQLANALPADRFAAYVCATRRSGPLEKEIAPHVTFFNLRRRGRFDAAALLRLRAYVKEHGITILHAHGTSAFTAVAVHLLARRTSVVWHDHYGRHEQRPRAAAPYRLLASRLRALIVVNAELRRWAVERLGVPETRVWLAPNFPAHQKANDPPQLPGEPGYRIAQVANLRPQKDHAMMIRAMAEIAREEPRAHLLLIGQAGDDAYARGIRAQIERAGLEAHVTLLGARDDVPALLSQCDVGVLSSQSEGLPLALLEYGAAGLAAVSTAVGDCPAVLGPLAADCLVQPGDSDGMAAAVLALLRDPARRRHCAHQFAAIVSRNYSEEAAIRQVVEIYEHAAA